MQSVPKWFWAFFTIFCCLFFGRFRVYKGKLCQNLGRKIMQKTPKGHHFKTHCLKVVKSLFSFLIFPYLKVLKFLSFLFLFDFQSYIWGIYFGHPLHVKEVGLSLPCIAKWREARACYFPLFTFNCLPHLFSRKRVVWLG